MLEQLLRSPSTASMYQRFDEVIFCSIEMPNEFIDATFQELLFGLLNKDRPMLAIALYRRRKETDCEGDTEYYVYTAPRSDSHCARSDYVFVLREESSSG